MPDKSLPKMTEEEKDWDSSWAMLAEQVLSPRQPCPDPTWIRSPVVLVPDSKPGRNGKLHANYCQLLPLVKGDCFYSNPSSYAYYGSAFDELLISPSPNVLGCKME